jgi:hypothetical protein
MDYIPIIHRIRDAKRNIDVSPAHHRPINQAHCCFFLVGSGFMGRFSSEDIVTVSHVAEY